MMEPAYQTIAREIVDLCGGGFTSAELQGSLEEDSVVTTQLRCKYSDEDVKSVRVGGLSAFKVASALVDLREAMSRPGQEQWSRCTFTLFPDGQFRFDVGYDD